MVISWTHIQVLLPQFFVGEILYTFKLATTSPILFGLLVGVPTVLCLIAVGVALYLYRRNSFLSDTHTKMNSALESLDDMLWMVDTNYQVCLYNQKFFDCMASYCGESVKVGDVLFDVMNPKMVRETRPFYEKALSGKTVVTEIELYQGRHLKELELTFYPAYNSRYTIVGCTVYAKDVTELNTSKRLTMQAKREAEHAARAKTDFLSTMSHEIRTPMNAIIGLTKLLIQHGPREDQVQHLNTIKFSGDNLLHIINDILDYNKIESGRLELENVDFNLREMLFNLEQVFKTKAIDKNVELKFTIAEGVPQWVKSDSVRLNQVLTNLLGNAIKFTYEGYVELKVEQIRVDDDGATTLHFEVADTGIGIPKDKQKHIFSRFTQAESDTTRKFGGTGLGLSICQKLVEAFGGQILIQSELGLGSTFYFDVTMDRSISPEEEEKAIIPEHIVKDLRGARILLVEDNDINVMVVGEYLSEWNVNFDVAENGQEAVEMVQEDIYDAILMDLQMPIMDGYTATREIRKLDDPVRAGILIYALTADAMLEVREKVKKAGMQGTFTKPFDPEAMYRVLHRQLVGDGQ